MKSVNHVHMLKKQVTLNTVIKGISDFKENISLLNNLPSEKVI